MTEEKVALPPRVRAGLRSRLVILLALMALTPTLLLGWIAIHSARGNVQDEVTRGHLALIRSIGHELNTRLQDTRRALAVTASGWGGLRDVASEGDTEKRALARLLRRLRAEFPLLDTATALDARGKRVAGDALDAGTGFEREQANTYGGYVSDVLFGADGKRRVLMVVQARDRRGALFGFVAGVVDLTFVRQRLAEPRLGNNAGLLVVDGSGRRVAARGEGPKVGSGGQQRRRDPVIDRLLASHEAGHLEWDDDQGRRWLSVYRNIAGMSEFRAVRWGVILHQPTRDAYALASRTARNTLAVVIGMLVLALGVGAFSARRLTRPLSRLVRQTRQVAAGNLDIAFDKVRERDEIGQLAESFAVMVSELRDDRECMYALTEFRENLVRSLPIGVISIDKDGRILTLNPAQEQLSEVVAADAVGQLLDEVFPAERDEAGVLERLERVLDVGGEVDLNLTKGQRTPFSARKPLRYRVRITPLRSRSGEVDGAVILQEDLSESARLQQQLLRSEKLSSVGVLAAGVAHEINNPLTTILGYAKLLLEGVDADSPDRAALELVAEEAQRVQMIVRNLLDFSRQESGEKRPQPLADLIRHTLALVGPDLRKRRVKVVEELSADLPLVLVDGRRLEQVFVNLLTNAGHAMTDGGTLTLRSGTLDDVAPAQVYVEFSDDGPGIRGKNIDRIFDPFFTTKAPGAGTGLGLSVSHGIVSDHGGKIEVESTQGSGATFRVILPSFEEVANGR